MDVLTPEQRRRNMSSVRSRNTKPELLLRRGLHARGMRFRLHAPGLPGQPDLVFPRHHAVILVHGCFWHGHDCSLFKLPKTRTDFWKTKIAKNRERDERVAEALASAGWRVLTVWECCLKGPVRLPFENVMDLCQAFVQGNEQTGILKGELRSENS